MPGKKRPSGNGKRRGRSPNRNHRPEDPRQYVESQNTDDEERSDDDCEDEDERDSYTLSTSQSHLPASKKLNSGTYDNRGYSTGSDYGERRSSSSDTPRDRHYAHSNAIDSTPRPKSNDCGNYGNNFETRVKEIVSKAIDERMGLFETRIQEMVQKSLNNAKDPSVVAVRESYVLSDTEKAVMGGMVRTKMFKVMKFLCNGMKATRGDQIIEDCKNVCRITKPTTVAMKNAITSAVLVFLSNNRGHLGHEIRTKLACK